MSNHVFTEDQNTMEWYIDGIPVAELKRRYEAHDALVKALTGMQKWFGRYPEWIPAPESFDKYKAAIDASGAALAAAEVRNG